MKITPMYDYVLIKVRAQKEESVGGIFLGEAGDNDALIGDVIEIGQGVLLESGRVCPLPLSVGDSVVLPPHLGSSMMKIEGREYALLRAREILAVITNR